MKRKRDTNIHFGNDTLQKKMLKWTPEEDQKLLRLKKQGKSWIQIVGRMDGRSYEGFLGL